MLMCQIVKANGLVVTIIYSSQISFNFFSKLRLVYSDAA